MDEQMAAKRHLNPSFANESANPFAVKHMYLHRNCDGFYWDIQKHVRTH